jgi:acetyltransferase-like isoleucine patch superfamily enzyme
MKIPSVLLISITKSLYLSARFRGQIIVMRGTRIFLERGARIELAPGARLYLGRVRYAATPLTLRIDRNGRFTIRGTVQISRGSRIVIGDNAHLEMDDEAYLNHDAAITCWEHISIGRNAGLSWNTSIIDGSYHEVSVRGRALPRTQPLRIGARVLIGTGAIVVGASIGDGSVVAAGSVVTTDMPAKVLVSGNPARARAQDIEWAE